MKNQIILVIFIACSFCVACGQKTKTIATCDCSALIDPEFLGEIDIYDGPNGKLKTKIQHNLKEEDFIVLSISGSQNGFYHVVASYFIAGEIVEGWIKEDNPIGVYTSVYPEGDSLSLMSAPEKSSTSKALKITYTAQLFQVIDCNPKGWLKVSILLGGKKYEGWVAPDDQCDNPYATGN
jgi:hypothetical protein